MSTKNCNRINRVVTVDGTEYRLQRIIDRTATDIHHIIGKCNRMKYNTNAEENKTRINRREHVALNQYFLDKQDPRQQLLKVFNLVKQVLSPGVRNELYTILELTDDEMFYIPEVLKWQKKKRSGKDWNISQKDSNTSAKDSTISTQQKKTQNSNNTATKDETSK